jgi:hypothetical protein
MPFRSAINVTRAFWSFRNRCTSLFPSAITFVASRCRTVLCSYSVRVLCRWKSSCRTSHCQESAIVNIATLELLLAVVETNSTGGPASTNHRPFSYVTCQPCIGKALVWHPSAKRGPPLSRSPVNATCVYNNQQSGQDSGRACGHCFDDHHPTST